MRHADVTRLAEPYPGDASVPGPGPAAALEVDVPQWRQLEAEILANLSAQPPYGVAWWAPHPGTSRRILISDQLYACTHSAADNLIEAAVHRLEFLDYAERESDRLANAVTIRNGQPNIEAPRRQNPLEDVAAELVRLHVSGTVRALSGALDCLAGTIIGVVALPTSILKADFGRVRSHLKGKLLAPPGSDGERLQVDFAGRLEALIDAAGPPGWLEWALAFRNMLVHRGRRIEVGQFLRRAPVLCGPAGQPLLRVRAVTHLPRDPGRSDVEVFLDPSITPVLTEDAEQTLSGLLVSTRRLIDDAGQELLRVWRWRQTHLETLPQPAAQWPNGPSTHSLGFSGYTPGSFVYTPSLMMTHPVVVQRLRAAALDDTTRAQWRTFD